MLRAAAEWTAQGWNMSVMSKSGFNLCKIEVKSGAALSKALRRVGIRRRGRPLVECR